MSTRVNPTTFDTEKVLHQQHAIKNGVRYDAVTWVARKWNGGEVYYIVRKYIDLAPVGETTTTKHADAVSAANEFTG